jgi:hypothetical protein
MKRLLAAALICLLPTLAFAGSSTISVQDSLGATKVYDVVTDVGGNYISKGVICDQSAAANCATVTANNELYVDTPTSNSNLYTALTSAVPCLVSATYNGNNYTAGSTSPANCDTHGNVYMNPGGNVLSVTQAPIVASTMSSYFLQPTAGTNANNVKASAGSVYWVLVMNNSGTVNYLRLYNTAGTPTCSSATNLVTQIMIPASTTVGGVSIPFLYGLPFTSGIGICVTSGYATTDVTNATATSMALTIGYF